MVSGLNRSLPLKWIGPATTKYRFYRTWVKVRPVLTHFFLHYAGILLSLSVLSTTIRPITPRPPRPAGSPSSSASSGSSGSVHRECERSSRIPLPSPAPMLVHGPMHPSPRAPMMDARRYLNLFPRRRVAPPTPPSSDDEPSDDGEGDDREETQSASDASLSSQDVSSDGASQGSEQESTSFSSGPSDHYSSGSSSGGSSVGSGSVTSGSASDYSSDDNLVNRYFDDRFRPP
ncbi:hypothetical protein PIB30_066461 [Stylosanthes scabra]|uniref:Uncharacterized protein n=1 Tax=Stylosanthes scabra TaxID=79078 RepID=A0ABU6SNK4_9FABA|nr:hypothetical protein [Stylosanthes scabra]